MFIRFKNYCLYMYICVQPENHNKDRVAAFIDDTLEYVGQPSGDLIPPSPLPRQPSGDLIPPSPVSRELSGDLPLLPDNGASDSASSSSLASSPAGHNMASAAPYYHFHIRPPFRDLFMVWFTMAKNRLTGTGFAV
jgi:hypothetical protein